MRSKFGRLLDGLDPVDRLLDPFFEVLHAHRDAVHAAGAQRVEMCLRRDARVDLDGDLGAFAHRERVADGAKQPAHVGRLQVGGRAAAPMVLGGGARDLHGLADRGHLALDQVQVARRELLLARDDAVAGTEVAEGAAEGHVDVE
jgi:hypothetical protein